MSAGVRVTASGGGDVARIRYPSIPVGSKRVTFAITTIQAIPLRSVPEPASWMMMVGGFGLSGVGVRRRNARESPRADG